MRRHRKGLNIGYYILKYVIIHNFFHHFSADYFKNIPGEKAPFCFFLSKDLRIYSDVYCGVAKKLVWSQVRRNR
jgi:hypothetical protein